jgi:hypothetical protein
LHPGGPCCIIFSRVLLVLGFLVISIRGVVGLGCDWNCDSMCFQQQAIVSTSKQEQRTQASRFRCTAWMFRSSESALAA